MSIAPEIRVTVRIERFDGEPSEAVSGHTSGFPYEVQELVVRAAQAAIGLAIRQAILAKGKP